MTQARTVTAHHGAKLLSQKCRCLWMINPKVASRSIMAALQSADPDARKTGEQLRTLHFESGSEGLLQLRIRQASIHESIVLLFGRVLLSQDLYGRSTDWRRSEDYCHWLNTPDGPDAVADRHFLSPHVQIRPVEDGRWPDFVGHLENLDEDWRRVAAHLALPPALRLLNTMAGWEATPRASKAARSAAMELHLTSRSKPLLRTRYAEDFRLFGYSRD